MNPITMRVYGRYVVAMGSKGSISILFPNMEYGGSGFAAHTPLLAIPRHVIPQGTFPALAPTFRVMSFGDPNTSELLVWDLTGFTVTFDADGGQDLQVQAGCDLASLAVLDQQIGRTAILRQDSLTSSATGRTKTVAKITGATVLAKNAIESPDIEGFVKLTDALDGDPTNDVVWSARPQVDLLDVAFKKDSSLTIRLASKVGTNAEIKVTGNSNLPSLSITNVCACLTQGEQYDVEFAQYYRLLQSFADDRLVPKEQLSMGEEADCDIPGVIEYDE